MRTAFKGQGISLVAAVAAVTGLAASSALAGGSTHRTIAITGVDNAFGPGAGAGVTFSTLDQQQPTINDAGQVAFRGNSNVTGTPQGLWIHGGGVDTNVAVAGGARPGGGTYTSGTTGIINSMLINASGEWAFRLGASTGLFSNAGGVPARIMLTGDVAPDTGSATFSSSATGMPLFNAAGQAAFIGNLTTNTGTPPVVISGATANSAGIWGGMPGAASLLLRQNDTVTPINLDGSVRVGAFQSASLGYNGNGRYVVSGALQGSVTTGTGAGSNATMIASNRSGALEVISRAGDAAPDSAGAASTNLYRAFSTSQIGFNNDGRVAFSSSLRDAAGVQTATAALFTDAGSGTLRLIGKTGDPLPASIANANGAEFAGVNWGSAFNNIAMNTSGTTAFVVTGLGNTGGTNNTNVLFRMAAGGDLMKIIRSGDVAIPGGAPDGSNAFFNSPSNIQINSRGQLAFLTTLTGVGVSPGLGNGSALFGADENGVTCLLARTGDLFEVAPGDLRQVSSIGGLNTSGGQDGRAINLNGKGELVFQLDFSNGTSGIFVATVPAPGAAALLGLGGLVMFRRRR